MRIKPGLGSYLTVSMLFLEALVDLIVLPFRLILFFFRKKKITEEITGMITGRKMKL